MAVREPILKELLGYKKTKGETDKEAHRRRLRELFDSIGPSAAQPFQVMLSTPNALAVTFRDVLHGDPLQNELLGILAKKYAPAPCLPAAPSAAPPSGVTLPAVTLTDEGSFDVLHAEVDQRITAIREAGNALAGPPPLMKPKKLLLERLLPDLESLLRSARWWKFLAFHPANAASKAEALKSAGASTAGALVVSQLWMLYGDIALATQDADAKGVPRADRDEASPLLKLLLDFRNDNAILALVNAGMDADVPAMRAAFPAGTKAYELHLAGLDR